MDFNKLAEQYKTELMENVLPFWLQHSQDKEFGGYFTCLKRNGEVFDTDKFIWLQGRGSTVMTATTTGISRSTAKDIR